MLTKRSLGVCLLAVGLVLVTITGPVWAQAGIGKVRVESVDDQSFPQMKAVVTVVDANGIPMTGLKVGDFSAFEDSKSISLGVAEKINPSVPISLLLVIDKSGSMTARSTVNPGKTKLDDAKDAAVRFLEKLQPADRAAILAFGTKIDLNRGLDDDCIDPGQSKERVFTEDKGALINCVNSLTTVAGQVTTPLYDAAYKAVTEAAKEAAAHQNTPVVVLFTDGREGDAQGKQVSANPRVSAELAAKQDRIAIYTIGQGADADNAYLEALANNTGGKFQTAPDAAKLDEIYTQIADQLRTQYDLAWQSKIFADGSAHQLDLKITTGGKEIANQHSFTPQKPLNPGIRFQYRRPTGLFNLGRESEVVALQAGDTFQTNWTIVPDISARNEIEKIEYYFNDETEPAFVAEAFPFNLPWAATRRSVKEETSFTVKAVAYDTEGNQGEAVTSLQVVPGRLDPAWLLVIVGLVLLIAVAVLIFALRRQRQDGQEVVGGEGVAFASGTEGFGPPPSGTGLASGPFGQPLGSGTTPAVGTQRIPSGGQTGQMAPPASPQPRPSPPAWLLVSEGPDRGRQFDLSRTEMHIGRSGENDVHLDDPTISRKHATVRHESGQYYIYDLGSMNPTQVNGRPITRYRLEDGDTVLLGKTRLVFKLAKSTRA